MQSSKGEIVMKSCKNHNQKARNAENVQIRLTKKKNSVTIELHSYAKEDLAMLLEFSCSDHNSIKNPILFSTVASKDTMNEDSIEFKGKWKTRRSEKYLPLANCFSRKCFRLLSP